MIHLDVTDRCNLRCAHCLRSPSPVDIDVDRAKQLLREARRLGADWASLAGAEPTLHPEFLDLIAFATDEGYQVGFVTNGHGFPKLVPSLRRWITHRGPGLRRISVSLDGGSAPVHDAIRSEGSFREAVAAIMLAKANGAWVQVKTVVSRVNAGDMDAILRLVARAGVDRLQVGVPVPTERLVAEDLLLSPTEVARARERLLSAAAAYNTHVELDFTFGGPSPFAVCTPAQGQFLSANAAGRLVFCCVLSQDAYADDSDAWTVSSAEEPLIPTGYERFIASGHRLLSWRSALVGRAEQLPAAAYYPCALCAALHGQLEWLARFPSSPWASLLEVAGCVDRATCES
jgi:pyruvate-formate lyase-activating enzyme